MKGSSQYRISIQSAESSAPEAARRLHESEAWLTDTATRTLGGSVTDITRRYASRTMWGSPVQPTPTRYEWTLEVLALIPGGEPSEGGSPDHKAAEFASQIQKFAGGQEAEFRVKVTDTKNLAGTSLRIQISQAFALLHL